MKANKVLLIIQLVLMYISLVCCFVSAFTVVSGTEDSSTSYFTALIIVGIVLVIVAASFSTLVAILSFVSIFKKQIVDQTKFVMIYKILMIPYYIGNFVFCAFVIAGMLNPFLLIAIPLMITIFMFFTYVNMLGSSFVDFAYAINSLKNKTIKPNALLIIGIVFQFIFCLDFLGAIFIFIANRKKQIN